MATLRTQLPHLIPYLEEAVRHQNAETGLRIKTSRLCQLKALIEEANERLEEIDIPDSLVHCDFSLDNILVSGRGCLFTDWAPRLV